MAEPIQYGRPSSSCFLVSQYLHVVPLARIGTHGHLEGEVFLATVEVQAADRRVVVRPLENRGLGDLQAAFQGERIGRIPLRRDHDALELALRADDRDVKRVARDAGGGVRDFGNVFERRVATRVRAPEERRRQVGARQVGDGDHCEQAQHPALVMVMMMVMWRRGRGVPRRGWRREIVVGHGWRPSGRCGRPANFLRR